MMTRTIVLTVALILSSFNVYANTDKAIFQNNGLLSRDSTTWLKTTIISKDSLHLELNGWFMTNGDCGAESPVINLQKRDSVDWVDLNNWIQMDCGLPLVFVDKQTYAIDLKSMVNPNSNQPLPSGEYRFVLATGDGEKLYSTPFSR